MIRNRFPEKIMLKQRDEIVKNFGPGQTFS